MKKNEKKPGTLPEVKKGSQVEAMWLDVNHYVQLAEKLTVQSEEQYTEATTMLLQVKAAEKRAEEEKNKVLKPLNEAVKAERARWKPIEVVFEKINAIIRPKMLHFVNERERKAKADLEKLNKQIASGQIKKEETIARKEEAIYSSVPATTVHTGSGAATTRKVKKLVIVNRDLIPDEFWVVDEVKLREAVIKQEREVPGAKWEYENSLAII